MAGGAEGLGKYSPNREALLTDSAVPRTIRWKASYPVMESPKIPSRTQPAIKALTNGPPGRLATCEFHPPGNKHGYADRGIEVGAGEVTAGVNGQGDPDPPDPGNLKEPGVGREKGSGGHYPAAEKDQNEGSQQLADEITG